MNARTERLRRESLEAPVTLSEERALLVTGFYRANEGRYSPPVMRALCFRHLCERKTIWIGEDELIVGERGPRPKAVPTYPELTCHSVEDLRILSTRGKTRYLADEVCIRAYEETVIPYWRGRSMRDRLFAELPPEWHDAYGAGLFTEFMEQRAPGHTVLDGKIYERDWTISRPASPRLWRRWTSPPTPKPGTSGRNSGPWPSPATRSILFARAPCGPRRRDGRRRARIPSAGASCRRSPRSAAACRPSAPRDFHEALQAYWFCHLAVITELNGWDAFSPGHLDQHLLPFYRKGMAEGSLTAEKARELLEAFFVKFNNHPAPPKVGVTAAESGTYTDFANINLAGLLADGSDGSSEVSHLLLDVIETMHMVQPSNNVQISARTPDAFSSTPSGSSAWAMGSRPIFNADAVVREQVRMGKSLEDARAGGCSGCVETGAFGKEAYILTGYVSLPKILELALHDGTDPLTGRRLGPARATQPVSGPSTTCSTPSPRSSATSSKSRSRATCSWSACTPRSCPPPSSPC